MKIKPTFTYSFTTAEKATLTYAAQIVNELRETTGNDIINSRTGELMSLNDCIITLMSMLETENEPVEIVEM